MPFGLDYHTECSVSFDQAITKELINVTKIDGIKMVSIFQFKKSEPYKTWN